eukprot:901401-Rhodomonas_salina.1
MRREEGDGRKEEREREGGIGCTDSHRDSASHSDRQTDRQTGKTDRQTETHTCMSAEVLLPPPRFPPCPHAHERQHYTHQRQHCCHKRHARHPK